MAQKKILVVEDDTDISDIITYNLEKDGFQTIAVFDGDAVHDAIATHSPDLIILDIMLPGTHGLDVCKKLRREPATEDLPIIMLTAKSQEADKIVGLELGADDYVTKPFSPKELIARIKAVLRRRTPPKTIKRITIGTMVIQPSKHTVTVADEKIRLTATEFKLLHVLASKPGIVISREEILDKVFGYESASYDRTVDAHIKALRKKLGHAKEYIETVRGVGYCCKDED